MPSANKTPNIELSQWQGNEYPKREDFNSDNLIIDQKFKEQDEALATKETPAGAQAKVDALAGVGNTKTVKQLDEALAAHQNDYATFQAENILSQYKKDVTVVDTEGNPTTVEYLRKMDNTLAIKRIASNPDTNGYYQTVVEDFYNTDGTTKYKTVTYTFTYLANGVIDTSDGGVIS